MNPITGYSIKENLFTSARTLIYRATRLSDSQRVILKVLNTEFPSTEQVARLHREYRLTRSLAMEGVIEVLGLERFESSVAILVEDFGGQSLARLQTGRPMDLPLFLDVARRIANTLGRIHQRHVIHKDINPSNIIWNPDTRELKLIDFGISTELSRETPAVLNPSVLEGTLPYISPEATGRMNRAMDYRTDFYSLGVTMYELLTGRLPFISDDPMELVHCHIARVPVPPHELVPTTPPALSDIVLRLLSKRAEDRYQSAFALASDLGRCLEELRTTGGIPSFELARNNVSERFQIPQKLYGREIETNALLASFDRVATGAKELVLVAGYSGIGKSALVHEVHKSIAKQRGYFISGKFDQFNRNIPYASLLQALQELMRHLLAEPTERLVRWKEKLLGVLGPNASVIIDVIPEVAFIVGPQPRAPELPPTEARNRFHLVMEGFVRTFAGPEHPLVVFLDDLQWADLPSLELLGRLLTNPGTRHLLFIGAYRENEVDAAHPLLPAFAEMRRAGTPVSTITLGALGRGHCIELLADALSRAPADVEPLADICLRKTEGNPFFLGQFLLSLHQEGMVRFDTQAGRWAWDMDRIVHTPLTDNVVALMVVKIQKLPEDAQRVLWLAACIGNTFDLKTLAIVDARSLQETADSLWAGLREGLVLPLGDTYKFIEDRFAAAAFVTEQGAADTQAGASARVTYRFLHDRVQQAAYSLIPEGKRREVHLQIGRLMRSALSSVERDEELFTIVGHLNLGSELLTGQEERDELAELILRAGRKAQSSAAHVAALEYLETGIALLGQERWTRCYELALRLHTQAAEASFLCTDFQRMEHHAAQVLEHARGTLDQVGVYEVKIQAYTFQNRFKDSVLTARRILALLGIEFPAQPAPEHVGAALAEVKAAIGERRIEELIDLPPMTDPVMLAATRIFAISASVTYLAEPLLFPLTVLRQIVIATKHGNTGALAYGYSTYGIILVSVGAIDSAYAFGKLALRLLERYEAREYSARTLYIWNSYILPWKEHVREALTGLQDVYQKGLEVGDLEFAGWSAIRMYDLFVGQELAELDQSTAGRVQAIAQLKQESALYYTTIQHQMVQNLRGLSEQPCLLIGAAYDERKMLPVHLDVNDTFALAAFFSRKLQLCFLFGRHAEALDHAVSAERYLGAAVSTCLIPEFHLFDTLTRLALYTGMPPAERESVMKRIDESIAKMGMWAGHAPMNYAAKHALMEAERHRVLNQTEQARAEYYRAIALAREHEYRNDEALATELFAAFLRQRGEHEVARLFLTKARHLYHLWGAEAKVREIDRTFPELRTTALGGETLTLHTAVSTTTTSEGTRTSQALDLVSVLKASQAISGEVVLPELLKKLVRLVVENAGARSGLLILEGERPLIAVAQNSIQGDADAVTLHESLDALPVQFSRAIVRYVERTHEVLVLGDASQAEAFQSDPYVVAHRPKSVLCMPILHQKKRVGLLYLENELLANAFTPDHCQVLSLLAAQAAISLENAKLYDTLDTRVKERTRELSETLQRLQQTQKQLVLQEKLASLGSLTSGIAHEIKNPLNFVNNFAELTVSLVSELREELKPQGRAVDPAAVEQLLGDLEHNAMKIHEHGARADRIVRAMLEHARTGPGTTREANVNELVREYVNLALTNHRAHGVHPLPSSALRTDFDESLGMATVASEDLGRVILNLTNNALHALVARSSKADNGFTPRLEVMTRDLEDRFEIRIRDNGVGIPAQAKGKIFTPFFTTKPPGQGTGLGLSISHDIVVHGHGGTMTFTSEEGEGTEFVMALPKGASATPGQP